MKNLFELLRTFFRSEDPAVYFGDGDFGEVEEPRESRWATPEMPVSPYVLDWHGRGEISDEMLAVISTCRDLDLQEEVSENIALGRLSDLASIRAALV